MYSAGAPHRAKIEEDNMTMALNGTQAPAQNLAYNMLAGSDAAGQSDGGTHRASAPTCYYPLAPARRGNGNGNDISAPARQAGCDSNAYCTTTSGSHRVDRSAYGRDAGVRRSLAASGVAVYPDGWGAAAGDTQPVETAPCRVASRWRHVLDGVASLLSPMVWLLPMATRPEHASALLPAAGDRCPDADAPQPGQADDLQGYERYLAAVSYGNAY
jgi:hypothetical protein